MSELRVLHILGALKASGMERMLESGAEDFAQMGIRSFVIGQGSGHSYIERLEDAGYTVSAVFPSLRKGYVRSEVRSFIRAKKIDVVHIHTEGNYLLTVLACKSVRGRHVRVVRTVHNVFHADGLWRMKRRLQAMVADRFVDVIVAPSEDVAENEKTYGRNPQIIYNWVDRKFTTLSARREAQGPSTRDRPVALIVGNCSGVKNHEFALRLVGQLGHDLIHVGSEANASSEELEALDSMERAGSLLRRGQQSPDMAMLEADYFLMPSLNEGMPVALAEALVVGLPVFAANVPGMKWVADVSQAVLLPLEHASWIEAIDQVVRPVAGSSKLHGGTIPDFSSRRGVTEYAQVYRHA